MHFHELLALRLVEEHDDGVTVELPLREDFANSDGYLHGGVTAALRSPAQRACVMAPWVWRYRGVTVRNAVGQRRR